MLSYISGAVRRYADTVRRVAEGRDERYHPGKPLPRKFVAASTRLKETFDAYKDLRDREMLPMSAALNSGDAEGAESRYLELRAAFSSVAEAYEEAKVAGIRARMPEEMMRGIREIECTYEFMGDPSYFNAIMLLLEGKKKPMQEKDTKEKSDDRRLKFA